MKAYTALGKNAEFLSAAGVDIVELRPGKSSGRNHKAAQLCDR